MSLNKDSSWCNKILNLTETLLRGHDPTFSLRTKI